MTEVLRVHTRVLNWKEHQLVTKYEFKPSFQICNLVKENILYDALKTHCRLHQEKDCRTRYKDACVGNDDNGDIVTQLVPKPSSQIQKKSKLHFIQSPSGL